MSTTKEELKRKARPKKVDTPRNNAWYTQVNKPGFCDPKPVMFPDALRYRIEEDGRWTPIPNK